MFGNNPIRKQDLSSPSYLWVQEVFPTIQGEGPHAGRPAIFVRLGGCNLKCYWCDTDFESSTWHPHMDDLICAIIDATEHCTTNFVVFTGGEPMRQNIRPTIAKLIALGYECQIETNGALWIDGLENYIMEHQLSIICSPKTGKVHPKIEEYSIAYKYIVSKLDADPQDGLPIMSTQRQDKRQHLARPPLGMPVYVQPLDAHEQEATIENERHAIYLCKTYGYRLSYQLHKHLGLP